MTQQNQIYKCSVCGNIVQVLHTGVGELVCCEKPMELMAEKTQDEGKEKHVPIMEKTENGVKVKVGSIPHPMEEKHYIEWIQIMTKDGAQRAFLLPGQPPEAEFCVLSEVLAVRAYCNIHGLWLAKIS